MAVIYFPSCKFTAQFPDLSKTIQDYVTAVHGAQVAGCCRAGLDRITEEDTVLYICNTCAAFFRESTPAKRVLSLWELLLTDPDFSFPDHSGGRMAVQDCWRAYDDRPQQEAVREILRRMKIEPVELEENFEKTRFCGYSLYEPLPPRYDQLAPKRLGREGRQFFRPHSQEEKETLMARHCEKIPTPEVVCSCVACYKGLALGGKQVHHLAQLVFPQ